MTSRNEATRAVNALIERAVREGMEGYAKPYDVALHVRVVLRNHCRITLKPETREAVIRREQVVD